MKSFFSVALIVIVFHSCQNAERPTSKTMNMKVSIYETSAQGNKLSPIPLSDTSEDNEGAIYIDTTQQYQTITGFGGAFTEASAALLNELSKENRERILKAYFSQQGANYSLTRTHMNSCDFSLNQYSYAPAPDKELKDFTIQEDMDDLIPMIQGAIDVSEEGFRIIASPWTAPPWMKDNKSWIGGRLLPEYYETWALFFSKYIEAYREVGIDIWGFTVENEPHGNGNNWESMHFTPEEMTHFVQHYLGPRLEGDGYEDKIILGYDQNRAELPKWVDVMYADEASSKYYDGTAIHWYESTYEVYQKELEYAHAKAPTKYLIQTEACVDAEVPRWKDDDWYWSREATDWGWDWAPADQKYLHPKYVPVYRYARDIIGCLNHWVDGWIDWNMVLDRQGGPNWFKNWCVAPVIVDTEHDEVYFTPLYYVMAHFSKFIRPGAKRVGLKHELGGLQITAVSNPDGSIVTVLFNPQDSPSNYSINIENQRFSSSIDSRAIQTIIIHL